MLPETFFPRRVRRSIGGRGRYKVVWGPPVGFGRDRVLAKARKRKRALALLETARRALSLCRAPGAVLGDLYVVGPDGRFVEG